MPKDKIPEARAQNRKKAGYGSQINRNMVTPTVGLPEPVGTAEVQMARDGLRYGNPDLPRFATGRVDGAAPPFHWPADDDGVVARQAGRGAERHPRSPQ